MLKTVKLSKLLCNSFFYSQDYSQLWFLFVICFLYCDKLVSIMVCDLDQLGREFPLGPNRDISQDIMPLIHFLLANNSPVNAGINALYSRARVYLVTSWDPSLYQSSKTLRPGMDQSVPGLEVYHSNGSFLAVTFSAWILPLIQTGQAPALLYTEHQDWHNLLSIQ